MADTVHSQASYAALRLQGDRRVTMVIFWAALIAVASFTIMDLRLVGLSSNRTLPLVAFRLVWVVGTYFGIRAIAAANDRYALDRAAAVTLSLTLAAMVVLVLLRPPENYSSNRLQVIAIFFCYGALTLPPRLASTIALVFTAACVLLLIFYHVGVPPFERDSIIAAFAFANVGGFAISVRRARLARSETIAWDQTEIAHRDLAKAHIDLQATVVELKTLRGILPICSYCNRIRDDGGGWERLEFYVTQHTAAKFSHGVCPDCYAREFPGMPPV